MYSIRRVRSRSPILIFTLEQLKKLPVDYDGRRVVRSRRSATGRADQLLDLAFVEHLLALQGHGQEVQLVAVLGQEPFRSSAAAWRIRRSLRRSTGPCAR